MKKLLSFIVMTLMGMSLMAKPVDPTMAVRVAQNFAATQVKMADNTAKIVYTHPMPESGQPAMYVVNVGSSAFVIVAADDIAHPVLGYSMARPWPVLNGERRSENGEPNATEGSERASLENGERAAAVQLPSQVSGFLDDLASQIRAAQQQDIAQDRETATEWQRLLSSEYNLHNSQLDLPDSVGPLLTTTWDQGQYYNALCPEDVNGPDGHALTGCVATAMAQIINYWGYPVHGRGSHTYNHNTYGTLTVNYDSANYDYANMPSALTATSTPQQVNAVAQLMRDCGVAVAMDYGSTESSSYDVVARVGFINYFQFSPNLSYIGKGYFSFSEWNSFLRTDISAGLPVYYSGQGSGGHAFVCDGYKTDNYYHFNFGWSGYSDGWYLTSSVRPGGMDFTSNQKALIGIIPDSTGNVILGHIAGTSSYTIEKPIEFYHLLGHNDYWGDAYSNDCRSSAYFHLSDMSKHIEVTVKHFEDQYVDIVDSIGHQLRQMFIGNDMYDLFSPFVGASNTVKLEYSGSFYPDGFHLRIGEENTCKPVNQIAYAIDTTSVHLKWKEYGAATQWEVEYGPAGFILGQGTTIAVNDTNVFVENLQKNLKYDFYIRSVCSDTTVSDWNSISIQLSPYWTDIVTSVPEGYSEDAEGNVFISSAEGLAWLAVQVNGLHGYPPNNFVGKTVTLMQDIDLIGYRWNPIGKYWHKSNDFGYHSFLGTFDGGNHTISNMYVRDTNSMLGLFGSITSVGYGDIDAVIKNVKLEGGSVVCVYHNGMDPFFLGGWGMLGGLIGNADGKVTIDNCHSSVMVKGRSRIGALCGSYTNNQESFGYIRNCSANGILIGYYSIGGIVGDLYGNILLENSYSYGTIIEDTVEVEDLWMRGDMGGLVGSMAYSSIANCYSTSTINYQTNRYVGLGVGEMYGSNPSIKNVYCKGQDGVGVVGGNFAGETAIIQDISSFESTNWNLNTMVAIQDSTYGTLLGVLNAYVIKENNEKLFMWKKETSDTLVVHSASYIPSCYNPYNIQISNGTQVGDTFITTKIEWEQEGTPDRWEVLYVPSRQDIDSGTIVSVVNNPCFLSDIPIGVPLDFYLRAVCDSDDYSNWSGPTTYIPDKMRWTEVVTSQPEGYQEDENGNVYISSAEGLAWLSSVVNELNGAQYNDFNSKQIFLMADIDLSDYRWTAIGCKDWWHQLYCSSFEGNNHTITGLYCNELSDYQGLFGLMSGGVRNLIIKHCNVFGENYVGAIAGYSFNNHIVNCFVSGNVQGINEVGGVIGRHLCRADPHHIINSCFIGTVSSRRDIVKTNSRGAYVGGICGIPFYDTIINCYVACEINDYADYSGIITGTGGQPNTVSNCYYKSYETLLSATSNNCDIVNVSSFSGSDTTWTLNTSPYVNGAFRTDLVDALNAWVDENNTDGQYFHWRTDTANINGGYPVFEVPPCLYVPRTFIEPSITACDSYTFNGVTYTESVSINDTLQTVNGCDSIVSQLILINHPVQAFENVKVCEGQSYTFNGRTLTETNSYYDTIFNGAANGCDSIVSLWLEVQNPTSWRNARVCEGQSYAFNGRTLTETGYYYDTIINGATNGCDSIVYLWLEVQNPTSWHNVRVCEGQSYTFNGRTLTETNSYYDTIFNGAANGCDSIVYLWLEVQNPTSWHNARVCEGQSYTFNGRTLTETNGYYDTIFNGAANGCDSIVYLWLEVQNNYSYPSAEICQGESYSFAGQMLTEPGTYLDTLTGVSANGCDSIVQLNFTVHPTYYLYDTVYLPANSLPYLYSYQDWTQEVDDFSVTMNSNTQIVDTRVNPSGTIYDNGGPNGNYSDNFDGTIILTADEGETIKLSGNYQLEGCCDYVAVYDGYGTSGNCLLYTCGDGSVDVQTSTGYLTLRFTSDVSANYDGFALQWNTARSIDTLLTATGDYSFEAHTSYGCDNTFNLHLEPRAAYNRTDSVAICSNNLPYAYADTLISDAGTYTFTYLDRYGIDSTVTLHLTINHSTTGDTTAVACDSFIWWNTNYTNSTNAATHTLTNAAGCDSTVTLHLTINHSTTGDTTAVACDSFIWWNTNYTNSTNEATHTLTNAAGCDSVVTLHLTINNPVHTATTETACETYTWNGTAYIVSGDYTYSHLDNNGCTQVDTLHLTINNPVHTATTEAACETYTWNGSTYTVSGDYTYSHLDNNGCTQVDTLHLTINNPVHTATTEAACETYTWNGTAYTVSGDYTYNHLDVNGCTQVDTLHLTINNPVHTATTEAACETYTWNGTAYTVSGDYTYGHADNNGCTQVDTLHLTVNHSTTGDTAAVACDSFTWWNTNYTNSTNDATHTLTNAAGCDSTVTLHLTINHSTTGVDVQTACDSYTWIDGNTYTESNFNSQFSILNSLGCDSTVTLNLTINHSVTFYDTLTIDSNELPYDYYGNSIDGQGNFTFEGTTSEGCDSTTHLFVIVNQVGIGDVQTADGITLFPNPTRGTVTVSGNGLERVEVMDVVGRTMLVVECQRDSEMVDLSELPQGAYVVRIIAENGTAVRRVVKR